MAAKKDVAYEKIRSICLSFPDTIETMTWGKPHFRVADKIFAGYGEENGKRVAGFKLAMDHAKAVVTDKRFWPAPYVGHKGWVSMDTDGVKDWDVVREMIRESYTLIAPKKSLAKLDGGAAGATVAVGKTTKMKATKKVVAKKAAAKKAAPRKAAKKAVPRKIAKKATAKR